MTRDEIPPADEVPAPAQPGLEGEPEAWARVEAAWQDEAVHRAYLARFADLEGLAVAGGRYRAALAGRPGDALAARFREEVVKRAAVQGLASLPRAAPRAASPRRRWLALGAVAVSGALTAWAVARLVSLLSGGGP